MSLIIIYDVISIVIHDDLGLGATRKAIMKPVTMMSVYLVSSVYPLYAFIGSQAFIASTVISECSAFLHKNRIASLQWKIHKLAILFRTVATQTLARPT